MTSRKQASSFSDSDSDDDDLPEEVSTSAWGKETFLSKKKEEQQAREEIKRLATERRKNIAKKIRKRQEEAKKNKAAKLKREEVERQRRIANGEYDSEDDDHSDAEEYGVVEEKIDYTKPQMKEGFYLQVLADDDDGEIAGRKSVEKSALDFANRALYKNKNRVSTHLSISAKRAGKPAYHFNQKRTKRLHNIRNTKRQKIVGGK